VRDDYQAAADNGIARFRWARLVDEVHSVLGNDRADELGAVPYPNSWGRGYLDPRGGTAALTAWPLPDDLFAGENDKAEGLIFAPQAGWLIALDLERDATNLFQITGVPT
jgi:hypothetical protein